MNTKKYICSLLVLILVCMIMPIQVFAETRNIYIGDIITLEIMSRDFSAAEIMAEFQDFEIIEIKEENGGYLVSLRTFEIGEHKILLGGNEIIINVQSTFEDITGVGIFDGDTRVEKPGFPFHWRILFYISTGIFILSGGFILFKTINKKKIIARTPHQLFLHRSALLSAEDENYFVDLTYYFKEYLQTVYRFRIIGKTSGEIITELKETHGLETMIPDIQEWLTECDRLKFTGVHVQNEEKQELYIKLLRLVEKIDTQKEETA